MKKVKFSELDSEMKEALNKAVKNQLNIRNIPKESSTVGITLFSALYTENLASIYLLDELESPPYPLSSGTHFYEKQNKGIGYFSTDGLSRGDRITIYLRKENWQKL